MKLDLRLVKANACDTDNPESSYRKAIKHLGRDKGLVSAEEIISLMEITPWDDIKWQWKSFRGEEVKEEMAKLTTKYAERAAAADAAARSAADADDAARSAAAAAAAAHSAAAADAAARSAADADDAARYAAAAAAAAVHSARSARSARSAADAAYEKEIENQKQDFIEMIRRCVTV